MIELIQTSDRTINQLIPEGWEVVRFNSHEMQVQRTFNEETDEFEVDDVKWVYQPHLTIQNKSNIVGVHYKDYEVERYDYEEHTWYLSDKEVLKVIAYMNTLTTNGGKP